MNDVCDCLRRVAPYDVSVLIMGESGTGKELVARALHYNSLRWNKPFVVENCGAMPDDLLESELFGHRRGSFTGAVEDHVGLFQRADGGTVLLDEIGEVSPSFQVKLLRVLQEGEIRPVGGRQHLQDRRALSRRHQPRSGDRGRGRALPRGSRITASRPSPSGRHRCATGPWTFRSSPKCCWRRRNAVGQDGERPVSARRSIASSPTTGRATCANCKTRSSVCWSWGPTKAVIGAEQLSPRILCAQADGGGGNGAATGRRRHAARAHRTA